MILPKNIEPGCIVRFPERLGILVVANPAIYPAGTWNIYYPSLHLTGAKSYKRANLEKIEGTFFVPVKKGAE